jgi:selenocysteine lyase/cysteine desulfurase
MINRKKNWRVLGSYKGFIYIHYFKYFVVLCFFAISCFLFDVTTWALKYSSITVPGYLDIVISFWKTDANLSFNIFFLTIFTGFSTIAFPIYSINRGSYAYAEKYYIHKRDSISRKVINLCLLFLCMVFSLVFAIPEIFFIFSSSSLNPNYFSPSVLFLTSVAPILLEKLFNLFSDGVFKKKSNSNLIDFPSVRPEQKLLNLNIGSLAPRLFIISEELDHWNKILDRYSQGSESIFSYVSGNSSDNESVKFFAKNMRGYSWKGTSSLRFDVAKFLDIKNSDQIIFLSNTTRALEFCLDVLQPSTIITTDHEYLSQNYYLNLIKSRYNSCVEKVEIFTAVKFDVLEDWEDDFVNRLVSEARKKPDSKKVILFSHVCYSSAWKLRIHSICKKIKGKDPSIFIIIDGAHAVGHIDVNLASIEYDFYVFCSHKWLFSMPTLGIISMSDKILNNSSLLDKIKAAAHETFSISRGVLEKDLYFPGETILNSIHENTCNNYIAGYTSTVNLDPFVTLSASIDKFLDENFRRSMLTNLSYLKSDFVRRSKESSFFKLLNPPYDDMNSPGIILVQFKSNDKNTSTNLSNVQASLENHGVLVKMVFSPYHKYSIRICLPYYLRNYELEIIFNKFEEVFKNF